MISTDQKEVTTKPTKVDLVRSLYINAAVEAANQALTKKTIEAGFRRAGICPFNPQVYYSYSYYLFYYNTLLFILFVL